LNNHSKAQSARLFCGVILAFTLSPAMGDENRQPGDSMSGTVAEVFQAAGIDGTLVVASADGNILQVHNDERSKTRFSPASTFKVPNTLIALDAAIVTSKDARFEWDGTDRGLPAWNRDQTLESAFRVSCVWCYQEIARSVGLDRYRTALATMHYGNEQVGQLVDQFWLNGELQISALEQIEFLSKLVNGSTPYRREQVDIVKAIMLDEQTDDYSIHAKTGWTGPGLHTGWYVGYVEKGDDTWLFAMNMRMDSADQAPLRKQLTLRSLKVLGFL
jgi:beta-lactamase class D